MDYGVYNDNINTYEALMSAVFNLFWDGDAEALEVISSSKILNKILKRNGMIKQPNSKGTRHPHRCIFSVERNELSITPTEAANITATCWLPDCQLT